MQGLIIVATLGAGAFVWATPVVATHTEQHGFLVAQKNRREVPAAYEPLTFDAFLALPILAAQYIDADWRTVRAQTARAASLEGYIAEVFQASDGATYGVAPDDGDFHVHLRPVPPSRCYASEGRGKQVVVEVTPHFQGAATGWTVDKLLALCDRQAKVRVSGWLLHDYEHVQNVGDWRGTAWEVHPVTRIEVWEPHAARWEPLR